MDYTQLIERLNAAIDENAFEETNTALQDGVATLEALQARVLELEQSNKNLKAYSMHERSLGAEAPTMRCQELEQELQVTEELEHQLKAERDSALAKLRELEGQKPIGYAPRRGDGFVLWHEASKFKSFVDNCMVGMETDHTLVELFIRPVPAAPAASPKCPRCQTPNSCGSDGRCLEEYIAARLKSAQPEPVEPVNQMLLDAVQSFHTWAYSQRKQQSKGGHASFDYMELREQMDIAEAALAAAKGGAV